MEPEQHNIEEVQFARYLSGEMSSSERVLFQSNLEDDDKLRSNFKAYQTLWNAASSHDDATLNIDVDSAWKKVSAQAIFEAQVDPVSPAKPSKTFRWIAIAASLAAITIISLVFNYLNQSNSQNLNRVASTQSKPTQQVFSDGTEVTLNAFSSIEYPATFDDDSRSVKLEGSAYFDVARDEARPFKIETRYGGIEVLGTAFEVSMDTLVEMLTIQVNEGKVRVTDHITQADEVVTAGERCTLKPGEKPDRTVGLSPAAFFWKDRTLRFKRTNLEKALEIIGETMNVSITHTSAIADCQLTATFKEERIETILEVIATTLSVEWSKTESGYHLSGEGC